MQLIKGKSPRAPWLIGVYGVPGIGKSTLASLAPKPVFLDVEGGLSRIDCQRTPRLTTWAETVAALKQLVEMPECETIVVDTVSAMEQILTQKVLDEDDKKRENLEAFGWGTGFTVLAANWALFIRMLGRAKDQYGKNVILVGHSNVERVNDPTVDPYDRFSIDTHKKCLPIIVSQADAVFFMRYDVRTVDKVGAGDKKKGISTGDRLLHAQEAPAWLAKNRFGFPANQTLPKKYEELAGWARDFYGFMG